MKTKLSNLHIPDDPTDDEVRGIIQHVDYAGRLTAAIIEDAVQAFSMNRDSFELAELKQVLRYRFGKRITRVGLSRYCLKGELVLVIRFVEDLEALQFAGRRRAFVRLPFRAATFFKRFPKPRARRRPTKPTSD